MSRKWPIVKLRDIVVPVQRDEMLQPNTDYRQIGVKLWGEGAYERESIRGSQTNYKKLFRAEADDLIVNKIWARNGSVAVVTEALSGCYGSGEFPMFSPQRNKVEPRWIHWLTKTPNFWMQCDQMSQGTSGKNRIRPEKFLEVELPLPSLDEQQRIVARIEELAGAIEKARGLRARSIEECSALMNAEEVKIWDRETLNNAPTLEDVTTYLARGRQSKQGESNHYLIKTQHVQMGRYVKTKMTLATDVTAKVTSDAMVKGGDILIACSAAGCLGRVAYFNNDGLNISTDTHVAIARANRNIVGPEYLYAYLKGYQGQIQLRSREKGDWQREKIGFRLTELNVSDMRRIPVPVPSLPEQHRIVAYLDDLQAKVDALKRLQSETAAELDALLPSILDKAFKGEL